MSSAFEGLPKTPNLKLNKPGYDNVADIEALNENADILDEEIQGIKNTFVKSVNGINAGDGGNVDLGIMPIAKGGTGQTTASGVRNALGLGNTTGAVPIANGGTGASTAEQARTNLGLGSVATLNAVPIANGGTGATTASDACANLGAVRKINDITPDNGVVLLGNIVDTGEGSNLSGYLSVGNANLQFRLDTVYVGPSGTITFNEPFSKYCVGVVFAFAYSNISEPRAITIYNRSKTGFSYECCVQDGSGARPFNAHFTYLAIGY